MLGMYDMPALQPVNDRFWALIRGHLGFGPPTLTRNRDVWDIWQDPTLVLAQTCGMPYRTRLHGKVRLVATPDYDLPGCPPGHYRSVFVARKQDDRDLTDLCRGTFAYNEALSQSGWAAAITHLAARSLQPDKLMKTGSHAASAQAVCEGLADYASLDVLTWLLLQDTTNLGQSLRVVDRTDPTPALPYITAMDNNPGRVLNALALAVADLDAADRQALHLRGVIHVPEYEYLKIPNPPAPQTIRSAN